jgi:hypothetical protein
MPENYKPNNISDAVERILPTDPNVSTPLNLTKEEHEHLTSLAQQIRTLEKAGQAEQALVLYRQLEQELSLLQRKQQEKQQQERGETIEISAEVIEENQTMYDKLGLKINGSPINLEQELRAGNILLPAKEQKELAAQEGLTQLLIVPGQIKREDFLKYFKGSNYQTDFNSTDLRIFEPAPEDLTKTQAIENPQRPKQFYAILVSPQISCQIAHPETQGQSAKKCMDILAQKQNANPDLNLAGLTLEEYLLLDCLIYLKDNQKQHLEPRTWCWLLEEKVMEANDIARCLDARWCLGDRSVGVNSPDSSDSGSGRGARFAAVSAAAPA